MISKFFSLQILLFFLFISSATAQGFNGTLRPHPTNKRYFTDETGRAIYLTGSHTWANFQEAGLPSDSLFEWEEYLKLMKANHHNFMKLWVWEQAKLGSWTNEKIAFSPIPYQQKLLDGKTVYDLSKWNPLYFERLRKRVKEAGENGIYVSIMLFQGWSIQKEKIAAGNPWLFHPFNPANNVNGVGKKVKDNVEDNANMGTLHSLNNGDVLKQQEAYVRKVIETINDLDNVLFEIINEGGTKDWQYHIINYIKKIERTKPKQHPVGMSHAVAVTPLMWNQDLLESPSDWIAPAPEPFEWNYKNSSKTTDYKEKLRPNDTNRITILDTDHLWGCGGNYQWVWKSFLQGYNPIFMDPWQSFPKADTLNIKWLSPCLFDRNYLPYKQIRENMGATIGYSKRIDLAKSIPSPTLSSSEICLAHHNKSYIIWSGGASYTTVNLRNTNGVFEAEWFDPVTLKVQKIEDVRGGDFKVFKCPFENDAVLFLKKKI